MKRGGLHSPAAGSLDSSFEQTQTHDLALCRAAKRKEEMRFFWTIATTANLVNASPELVPGPLLDLMVPHTVQTLLLTECEQHS